MSKLIIPGEASVASARRPNPAPGARRAGGILVIIDIAVMELAVVPAGTPPIGTWRMCLASLERRPPSSLRLALALAEHGRLRILAAEATIVGRCFHV